MGSEDRKADREGCCFGGQGVMVDVVEERGWTIGRTWRLVWAGLLAKSP